MTASTATSTPGPILSDWSIRSYAAAILDTPRLNTVLWYLAMDQAVTFGAEVYALADDGGTEDIITYRVEWLVERDFATRSDTRPTLTADGHRVIAAIGAMTRDRMTRDARRDARR